MGTFFKNPNSECPGNPQSHLWILKWLGPHKYERNSLMISPWGALAWHKYEAQAVCNLCNAAMHSLGISEATLIEADIPTEKLAECRRKSNWVQVYEDLYFGPDDCEHFNEASCGISKGVGAGGYYCRVIWEDDKCKHRKEP